MAGRLDIGTRSTTVTFSIGRQAHEQLIAESLECGCSVSHIIRHAVMKELVHRRAQRHRDIAENQLAGQMDIEGNVHA